MNIVRYAKCFTDVTGPEVFKQCAHSWISNRKKLVGGKCEKEFSPPSSNDQICNAYHEMVKRISENWLFANGKSNITKMALNFVGDNLFWNHTTRFGRLVAQPETLLIGFVCISFKIKISCLFSKLSTFWAENNNFGNF